jgi:hypothetical protein
MSVTYDNVAFGRIEETLKQYVDNEFKNVYISPRQYSVILRYYHKCDISQIRINESVKKKSDRLKKHLLDKQTNSDNWAELSIDEIAYDVQDEENEENENLYIIEYTIQLTNYNHFN